MLVIIRYMITIRTTISNTVTNDTNYKLYPGYHRMQRVRADLAEKIRAPVGRCSGSTDIVSYSQGIITG
ncbi:hypothetical protein DSUL_50291 [Desulfovibrionales bacterium]